MRVIGITGTRLAPTLLQAGRLGATLQRLIGEGYDELEHGDCNGFDALAHDLAMPLGLTVSVRPPLDPTHRAFRVGHHGYEPAPYMTRNRLIVMDCTVLIAGPACPENAVGSIRSGTWATVRMARRMGTPVTLIWPDGRVETDRWAADDDADVGARDLGEGLQDVEPGAVAGRRSGDRQ